ncbi:MAG: amidohydrolase family protein [Bacteroidales bacterium]|nr:amidohydrolase family protein [Bacteroidales bacterium]
MRKIQSECLFPVVSDPIPEGVLIVETDGRILEVLNPLLLDYSLTDIEKHKGFLCPGFINTHCHLELSYLKGTTSRGLGLDNFIMEIKKEPITNTPDDVVQNAIFEADKDMFEKGIQAVCDISNTTLTLAVKSNTKIFYHTLVEVYASDPVFADSAYDKGIKVYEDFKSTNDVSLTVHSFYAVSEELFRKVTAFAKHEGELFSLHHLESKEELLYFKNKTGKIIERLGLMGVDASAFSPSGLRPLVTMSNLLPEKPKKLLVHNTFANNEDIKHAKENLNNVWWCLCPNSNLYIENNLPDFNLFEKYSNHICIGTDSLASNTALSILKELKTIQQNTEIPINTLFKWACLNGAEYMGKERKLGSFTKDKKPGVLLIENIDKPRLQLTKESRVKRLV